MNDHIAALAVGLSISLGAYLLLRIIFQLRPIFSPPRISKRVAQIGVVTLAVAYACVFGGMSILRYRAFQIDGYDLAIFDQAIWNSLHGRLLETTILPDITLLLSQRFSPILLAFVPLYAVWSSPIVLIVVQTLGIAFSVLPLFWFARARLGNGLALIVALAYVLFPALQYVNLFEFHEIALSIPLFALATYFVLHRRDKPMLLCLVLVLLVKEDMAFVVIFFGAYILLIQRRWRFGLALGMFGIAWSVLLLQCVIPFFNGATCGSGAYYYFGRGLAAGTGRYDYLGTSLDQIVRTLLTRPDVIAQHVVTPTKIRFVSNLLLPLAVLPLLGLEVAALVLPTLAISLLSDYAPQFSIEYHYTASLIPFLFFAMVVGIERLLRVRSSTVQPASDRPARAGALAILILATSATGYYVLSAGPAAAHFQPALLASSAHKELGHVLLSTIPPDAVVSAQGNFVPSLSDRRAIYGFPSPHLDYCRAQYLFADTTLPEYRNFEQDWNLWLAKNYFEIIRQPDGYFIARRAAPEQPVQMQYGGELTLARLKIISTERLRGGQFICGLVEWQASSRDKNFIVRAQLQDAGGHVFASQEQPLDFANSQSMIQSFSLRLSPVMPPGDYRISVSVRSVHAEQNLEARDASARVRGDEPIVGQVPIAKDTTSTTASQLLIENPFFVDMDGMRLMGCAALPDQVHPGITLPVGLYWRARGKPQGDYQVVVQLRSAQGVVVAQVADRPAAGAYPTTQWQVGEVLLDWHDLEIAGDVPAGDYQLAVLLRDAHTQAVVGQAALKTISIER